MNPEDFDLDRSIDAAWRQFSESLSDVLASMDDSADLHIDADDPREHPGCGRISFHADAPGTVRATVAGNPKLGPHDQLGETQRALLADAGWEELPDGTYLLRRPQEESAALADAVVVALRDAYGVPHPVFLKPDQLAEVLIPTPAEGPVLEHLPQQVVSKASSLAELELLIADELTQVFGYQPLRDDDGDWAIRVGSTMVFVRATPDATEVIVFSVVVQDVAGRTRAMEILNDFNVESRFVRFELIRDRVFVQMSVLAQPFVPDHLRQAVHLVSAVADGIDEALAKTLHGRTAFEGDSE